LIIALAEEERVWVGTKEQVQGRLNLIEEGVDIASGVRQVNWRVGLREEGPLVGAKG
jgi:hypothetical protein